MGKQQKQWQTIFLGSKITADGHCSHEIKRCLLLGRKPMANPESILKSRDITLLTNVHMVKAMFFPTFMWQLDRKEGWSLKNWCFHSEVLEKTLESPLDCKEIKPVNPKGNQPWIFIGITGAETEAPTLWPSDVKSQFIGNNAEAGKDWRQEEKWATENEMVGWYRSLNEHEFEHTLGESESQGRLACCRSWGCKELNTTEWLSNSN